jgi:hypothetical protein
VSGANLWRVYSAAVPTTAAMVRIATGTAIKTHLQVTGPSNADLTVVGWGVEFETVPTAFVHCELIETTTVAGTGSTAVVPSPLRGTSTAFPGTAGFGPSAEGTVAATTRVFDNPILLTNYFAKEWSLGREPILDKSNVLRVRMTTSVTVNALCWIDFAA